MRVGVGGVGVYWFYFSVRLSVRASFHLPVRLSVDQSVSALHLPQYWPDPFQIDISYQPTSESFLCVECLKQNAKF